MQGGGLPFLGLSTLVYGVVAVWALARAGLARLRARAGRPAGARLWEAAADAC
jgi:hypothetical protein